MRNLDDEIRDAREARMRERPVNMLNVIWGHYRREYSAGLAGKVEHRAWTGGSAPRPLPEVSRDERRYVSHLFREQCETFRAFWGDLPSDVCRTFWNRARHDAHSTFRA